MVQYRAYTSLRSEYTAEAISSACLLVAVDGTETIHEKANFKISLAPCQVSGLSGTAVLFPPPSYGGDSTAHA